MSLLTVVGNFVNYVQSLNMWLYFIRKENSMLRCASQAFLCRELTGALLEPNICASHSSVSLLHETLNPENQLKYTQTFILKIPTAKTQGVLTVPKVWNWTLWMCLTNAARKNNTNLREIQIHSWCNRARWFSQCQYSHCVEEIWPSPLKHWLVLYCMHV